MSMIEGFFTKTYFKLHKYYQEPLTALERIETFK